MTFFSFSGISLFLAGAVMTLVMLTGGKRATNMLWSGVCTAGVVLGIAMFLIGKEENPENALLWWRMGYVGVITIPVLIIHTIYSLLQRKEFYEKYVLYVGYIFTILFQILNIWGILIEKVTFSFGEIYFDYPVNPLFIIFGIYFNLSFLYGFYLLYRCYSRYKVSSSIFAKQISYFGIGMMFGALGGHSLYLPVFGIMVYPYLSILITFYPIIVGYAILNHSLFDARYSILRVLRTFTIFGIIVASLVILIWLSEFLFDYTPQFHAVETTIGILLLASAFTLYRSRWFSNLFLLSSLVEFEQEAQKFLEKKVVYENSLELLHDIESLFQQGIHIQRVKIMRNSLQNNFPHIAQYLEKNNTPLILQELMNTVHDSTDPLIAEVKNIGEAIFPLNMEGMRPTVLALGSKESEGFLTPEEVKIILRILPKVALALQILDFNSSLQIEVERQTRAIAKQNHDLAIAYSRLQEVDKNKDNFLAIASHELRTPMTIIKGYADLFLKRMLGDMTEKEEYYMKKIYESTDSLIELVNNILDISKIEAGRFEKIIADADPHALLQKTMSDFQEIYKEKNIALSLTDTVDSDTIRTDAGKFRLVLTNLLSNAYKFTPSGGSVKVEASSDKEYIHIRVCDTGMGISETQISSIFDKFNQANHKNDYTKKSIRGTGLGLNLSKQIVEMLGGTITVASKLGKGSCFEFTLPLTLG